MIFDSFWCVCMGVAVLFAVVTCAIAFFVKMRAIRGALTRIEHRQEDLLHHAEQAAKDSATAADALSTLLAWSQNRSGEPGNVEVIQAIEEAQENMADRMAQLEETHTAAAAIVARSISMAMPHLQRFSDWHAEWEGRTRLAERKKQRALKAGYQRKPEPPDPE